MSRKSKEDWLNTGIVVLVAEQGNDSELTIERLAKHIGLTKGSFYHHFKNLAEFKRALAQYMEMVGFTNVIAQVDTRQPAKDQLIELTQVISQIDLSKEKAMRLWAIHYPEARQLVQHLDQQRVTYLQKLHLELLGNLAQAKQMARMSYAFFLGAMHMNPPIQGKEYLEMFRLLEDLLDPPTQYKEEL